MLSHKKMEKNHDVVFKARFWLQSFNNDTVCVNIIFVTLTYEVIFFFLFIDLFTFGIISGYAETT